MDDCHKIQELLADYRTGVLSSRKVAWLEDHLKQCFNCENELHVLDDVLALVDANTPECEPPVGLWNGVYNRITSPEPRRSNIIDRFGHWISKPIRAAGVGVAALALAVSLIIGMGPRDSVVPVRVTSNLEYVQGHALYAGQAQLADRVSYLSVVAASSASSNK
ncbi:MAG: zf-HC2 domain-containing protein [Armatimonadota bacterium]